MVEEWDDLGKCNDFVEGAVKMDVHRGGVVRVIEKVQGQARQRCRSTVGVLSCCDEPGRVRREIDGVDGLIIILSVLPDCFVCLRVPHVMFVGRQLLKLPDFPVQKKDTYVSRARE